MSIQVGRVMPASYRRAVNAESIYCKEKGAGVAQEFIASSILSAERSV